MPFCPERLLLYRRKLTHGYLGQIGGRTHAGTDNQDLTTASLYFRLPKSPKSAARPGGKLRFVLGDGKPGMARLAPYFLDYRDHEKDALAYVGLSALVWQFDVGL